MAGPVANLRSLDSANFRTSRRADDLNEWLRDKLGLKHKYGPARLAIAHSLGLAAPAPRLTSEEADESGKIIYGRNLFGDDDLPLWVAMIVERAGLVNPSVEDIQEQVRRHWHRGVLLLVEEWKNCNEVYERFVLHLAERAGLPAEGRPAADPTDAHDLAEPGGPVPVRLRLGDPGLDLSTRQPATWLLNGKGSPHVALMGATGSGKTRLAVNLIDQIRQQASCPVLLFDMAKGDLAGNRDLVRTIQGRVIASPKNPIPLDALYLPDRSKDAVVDAAMRFRESFTRITRNRPGGIQQDALRDAARNAYENRPLPLSISAIRDELQTLYAQANRRPDTLTSLFNDLTQWTLFDPRMKPSEFFGQSWVIDLHDALETAQRLVVFLVLDALYAYFKSLPDSAIDAQGFRALRLVLVIDEARRVLGYGQPSLINLVRESRSKGVSVTLISQSPDDYDSEEDNFLENIGLGVCFKTNATSSRVLRAWLGQGVDLASLPDGVAVTRLPGQSGITRVKAWE